MVNGSENDDFNLGCESFQVEFLKNRREFKKLRVMDLDELKGVDSFCI